ncbi:MAG: TerC/Alx family metal homeostasis membrane protein [Flavisolibacter sp.]|jgi:tellurite resistance protein TerC|nr:TerC/Alx family metal homeostasis membrane protein [Flavisolibacter sp.]
MTIDQTTYLVFGIVVIISLIFDLGVFSKKSTNVSIRTALYQSLFWVLISLAFGAFMWWMEGEKAAMEYLAAYLMEKSLSIDNIFVFILIFSFFAIRKDHVARALFIGIILAIVFRIIFIAAGVVLVERFHWILYVFGAFLVYTGVKIFMVRQEDEFDPAKSPVYKFLNRFLPIIHHDVGGKLMVKKDGKRFFTNMFVVIIMLATTDIVFAVDSIPAVFAIVTESKNKELVIYTSNIFAVLGLRALFFLLQGAVNKFQYLQQGIAIVLIFIGLKMFVEIFHIKVPVVVSLLFIATSLIGSIFYSVRISAQNLKD